MITFCFITIKQTSNHTFLKVYFLIFVMLSLIIIVIIIIILIIIIIIMIGLKNTIRDFTIASLHCELSQTRTLKWPGCNRVQIRCSTYSAYHVRYVMCHLVRKDSSAIKFDRVEITSILALFY